MKDVDRFASDDRPPLLPFDLKVLLLYGVARFRYLIVALAVIGALGGVFFGASQPNVYTAEAKLRYSVSARQLLTDESVYGVSDADPWARRRSAPGMLDLMELLRDPAIYEAVVDEVGAREVLRVEDPSKANSSGLSRIMHELQGLLIRAKGLDDPCPGGEGPLCKQAAVRALIGGVKILPIRDTSLLRITYTATSPAKSKRLLDAIVKQFIQHHLEVYGAGGKLADLREQFDIELQKLNSLNTDYATYQQECGFTDIDGDFLDTVTAIRLCESNIRTQEIEASRLRKYVATLDEQLSGDAAALGGQALNPTWSALVQRRIDAMRTIAELEARPNLPSTLQRQLETARNELDIVERQLVETPKYTSDPFATALAAQNNPVIAQAQLQLATSRAELASVADRVQAEKAEKQKLEDRLAAIRRCQPQHNFHRASIRAAEDKFARIAQQIPELDTLALLDEQGRTNLTVFRASSTPFSKDGPQRSKPVALGLIAGIGIGVGFAMLRQLTERTVRYRETIEDSLDLPVLCVVPEVARLADGRRAA